MINYKDIKRLDLETSSLCNAECRVCSRRRDGGIKNQTFTETYMTIKQVKEWFSEDFIENLGLITMCGNYGDPIVAKDTLKVFKHFRSVNPTIYLSMNTNGSARTTQLALRNTIVETAQTVKLGGRVGTPARARAENCHNRNADPAWAGPTCTHTYT